MCHYKQLKNCVAPLKDVLIELHDNEDHLEVQCYCEQNCVGSEVYIHKVVDIHGNREFLSESGGAFVVVNMYPTIRYKRRILYSFADLFGMQQMKYFITFTI